MPQRKAAEAVGGAGLTETAMYRSQRPVSHSIKTALVTQKVVFLQKAETMRKKVAIGFVGGL